MDNIPVQKADIMMYAGKWYLLFTIQSFMNKHWRQTTETYVIHPDGYYAVFAAYKVVNEDKTKYFRSKLFVVRGSNNAKFKSQVMWPFKNDYWIIELAEDYSYAVVGHPKCQTLTIMSRKPFLPEEIVAGIITRCKEKGYNTAKLVSQQHPQQSKELTI